jgi:hypothetical protein
MSIAPGASAVNDLVDAIRLIGNAKYLLVREMNDSKEGKILGDIISALNATINHINDSF